MRPTTSWSTSATRSLARCQRRWQSRRRRQAMVALATASRTSRGGNRKGVPTRKTDRRPPTMPPGRRGIPGLGHLSPSSQGSGGFWGCKEAKLKRNLSRGYGCQTGPKKPESRHVSRGQADFYVCFWRKSGHRGLPSECLLVATSRHPLKSTSIECAYTSFPRKHLARPRS